MTVLVALRKVVASRTVLLVNSRAMSQFSYPPAKRLDTVVDDYHGTKVPDPYRWLEDPDSKETQAFVEAQNAVTGPYIDGYPFKEAIRKTVTDMWNYPRRSAPSRHGMRYYQYRNTGLQNQSVAYVMKDVDDDGQVFFDPNTLSEDGTVALVGTSFTEDGKYMAYKLSRGGSDWTEIRFRDVEKGTDFPDVLSKVKFSNMAWTHDNVGIFYGAYLTQKGKTDGKETDINENHKLYYHKLGTEQSDDVVVAELDNPKYQIAAEVSDCGRYVIVTVTEGCKDNLLYFAKIAGVEITGKLELVPLETKFQAVYNYVSNKGNKFVFHTNKDAPNNRLVVVDFDNPEQANWKTLVPTDSKDLLEWAAPINHDQLVLCYLRDVKNTLSLHKLDTAELVAELPVDAGTVGSYAGRWDDDVMFYSFTSYTTPNTIYKVDLSGGKVEHSLYYQSKLKGDYESSDYESKQVFYPSKDGTKIPMFIVGKKGLKLDGNNPCVLYGYGGFNYNITPSFSLSKIVFMKHFGGIYAVPNIRGGGEYGDRWHNSGRFEQKQNCFDDFQHAAKYLVHNNYTTPAKLTIQGGSNGGLLVAACINQAPSLFGAAICQVGVLDMLRFHKFTIGHAWKSDYGSSETPDGFDYLVKYSPLHNVRVPEEGVQYPATLLLTGDHDDRVVPLHSLKFIAELQYKAGASPQQTNPLMIRVETKAGHGSGKPTSKLIDEVTDTLCFIAKSCGLEFRE